MALPRKMRKDSIIGNLEPELRIRVDEILSCGGGGLQDVQDFLAEHGVTISLQSISEYNQNHLSLELMARNFRLADIINEQSVDGITEASIKMAKKRVFELLALPNPDARTIKALMEIIFKAETLDQSDRKLKLLEAKAAEAKKLAEDTLNTARKGLTPETIARLEEQLKLL